MTRQEHGGAAQSGHEVISGPCILLLMISKRMCFGLTFQVQSSRVLAFSCRQDIIGVISMHQLSVVLLSDLHALYEAL